LKSTYLFVLVVGVVNRIQSLFALDDL